MNGFDEGRVAPRSTFFLMLNVTNLDGTIDMDSETPTGFGTVEEAVEHAKERSAEHGGESFIYECRPIRRIVAQRQVRVTVIEPPQSRDEKRRASAPAASGGAAGRAGHGRIRQ